MKNLQTLVIIFNSDTNFTFKSVDKVTRFTILENHIFFYDSLDQNGIW